MSDHSPAPKGLADTAPLSRSRLVLIAVILIIIWGTAYNFIGIAVKTISPIWLVAARVVIGAALVTLWSFYRGHRFPPLTDKRWLWYIWLGFIGMVAPFYCISRGQIHVDSGLSAILVGTMPLITVVLAHFFASERLNLRKGLGFALGFMGTLILFLPDDLSLSLVTEWRSQGLLLLAALFYAVTTIMAKLAPDTPPSLGAAMMLIGASVMSVVLALMEGLPSAMPAPIAIWMTILLGVGSTGIGNILYLLLIRKSGPTMLAKINYFPAVMALAVGVTLLGEPFSWRLIAGLAVILLGLFIARKKTPAATVP